MPAAEVMRKFKAGTLKSGSGHKVTNPAQARAIAASYGDKGDSPITGMLKRRYKRRKKRRA
jgi:hypothetical protein